MAFISINHINIAGIAASVPVTIAHNMDIDGLTAQEKQNLIKTTGIEKRRIVIDKTTSADLCIDATQQLLKALAWEVKDIDILVYITQTPDHILPGSGTFIQHTLGLTTKTMVIDVNQGCAGYVYGLSIIGSMMQAGNFKRGLLLVGDTLSKLIAKNDLSLLPIFSDGGTCTAIEQKENGKMAFSLQSDGSGYEKIIVKNGGARFPNAGAHSLYMNGQDVFNFGLKEVVPNAVELLNLTGTQVKEIDYFVMHQANYLLNESIRKKLGIPEEKTLYSLKEYGNTSCATIPLTIAANADNLRHTGLEKRFLLSGFGVGLSWGAALVNMNNTTYLRISEYAG